MSANIVNQVAFLRTSREFPEELHTLSQQTSKSYVDIANSVNSRIIGIFPTNRPAVNGESWFLSNQRQQGLRQVYPFTSFTGTLTITHNINTQQIFEFSKIYGVFSDTSGNSYPLPYVNTIAVTNQISLQVTPTQIVITAGAGSPSISSGFVVLEWLSNSLNLGVA